MKKDQKLNILIYQMGKVGSSTITKSLTHYNLNLYGAHILEPNNIKPWKDIKFIYWYAKYYRKKLERNWNSKKWKIITLIRDPVARNISDYFYILFDPLSLALNIAQKNYLKYNLKNKNRIENLINSFINKYPHDKTLTWFDLEMKHIFGIDVYSVDFPISKGYKIYKGRNHPDLLLIRLEDLNQFAEVAFKEFLGIKNFKIKFANIAKDKPYYQLYKKFLSSKMIPQSYIERMYSSKFARHFYSEEELSCFKKKWLQD